MKKYHILSLGLIFLGFLNLSGCASFSELFSKKNSSLESYTSESFPIAQCEIIAADIVERLQSAYPPGQTMLYIYLPNQGKGELAQAVENLLRAKGFSIAPDKDSEAITLAWTMDQLDEKTWYLLVNLSSGYRFARLYSDNGKSFIPSGMLSQGTF
jgi:hypothetical protein